MELSEFTGKPCRTKMAYEFLPKHSMKIDLDKAAQEVGEVGALEVKTKVLLMIKVDFCTVSLFPSGKLLVRGEREEEKAKEIAKKVIGTLTNSIK
jgi:ribonuclease HIII